MEWRGNFPACCNVGMVVGTGYNVLDEVPCDSGTFICIFQKHQEEMFKKTCEKYNLLSACSVPGGHPIKPDMLCVCVFQRKTGITKGAY